MVVKYSITFVYEPINNSQLIIINFFLNLNNRIILIMKMANKRLIFSVSTIEIYNLNSYQILKVIYNLVYDSIFVDPNVL